MKMYRHDNRAGRKGSRGWGMLVALALLPVVVQAQPNLTLGFSSPATNASPGATFQGLVNYTPTGTVITATVTAGTAIVPQTNLSLSIGATSVVVTLVPVTNTSGTVSVQVRGVSGAETGTVNFAVVFRPYPPTIGPIANRTIPEDGSTNVPFTVSDPDTPLNSLLLTRSSSNTNLIDLSGMTLSGTGSNRFILLTPKPDINGTSIVTLAVTDGIYTNTRSFTLSVTPVPDPSTITGMVNRSFRDDVPVTNVFSGIGINDVDHNMPLPEQLVATALLSSDQLATFSDGSISFSRTGTPSQVTAAMAGVGVVPIRFRGAPGAVNTLNASVRVRGVSDTITVTNTITLAIEVVNTPPTFGIEMNPTSVVEGVTVQPFNILFIADPDIGDESFILTIEPVNTNQAALFNIFPTNVLADNAPGLQTAIRNINLQALGGIMTNTSETIAFRFTMMDTYGDTSAETNLFTIIQAQNPPQITGIVPQTLSKTDGDSPFVLFPTVFIQDPDQGGLQPVRATISQTEPAIGTISQTNFTFITPAQLSTALQSVVYAPIPGALPVGQNAESTIILTVTDSSGLFSQNTALKVRITSVNNAPQILNIPPPEQQPVLIPPSAEIRPFALVGLTSDDTNAVLFTLSIDNVNKGSFSNLGAFTQSSPGVFQMSGSPGQILASLTNILYFLNPGFLFPIDDPGGTTFTLTARDYALLTTTRSLYIQIQQQPRNHLVVRAINDGQPGSFTYALANAGNNDVITFALPSYPAIIRMPGSSPTVLPRNLRIKGPGANLLTISGDNNGDSIPNRQLFRIRARVVMEGLTLSHGTAPFGGAILVESNGFLTLRQCAVVDSIASQYGGAIDVDGGQLTLESCFIARNRLLADTGQSGAGVSVYTDKEVRILNTTFAGNVQPNETGDGGGALVVQNLTPGTPLNAFVTHCTFIENEDAAQTASAALSVEFGSRIRSRNSIFNDFSGRNIDVAGAGSFISHGGNICDDSSRTANQQQGQSQEVFLLDQPSDATLTDAVLAPLKLSGDPTPYAEPLPGSPAIGRAQGDSVGVDQRGVIRNGSADSGAIAFNALGRLVINEIYFDDDRVNYIELFVRRDSTPVDLSPYALYIDNVKVHDFADSVIVGTNQLFAFGASASPVIQPGFGMLIAFTNQPVSLTSGMNPTPVVRPSVTNAVLDVGPRGVLTIAATASAEPVARQNYLGIYVDPVSGTNQLNTTGNAISLAPQYRGYALLPHSFILPGPFDGADLSRDPFGNPLSPGAGSDGTPFGQNNAEPLALPDIFTVTEDDLSRLTVLANDFDGDGNDRLVIVDVSTASDPGTGDSATAISVFGAGIEVDPADAPLRGASIWYDPRASATLQALPVGVERIDTFHYEIIDIGSAAVEGYGSNGLVTVVSAVNHRLTNGVEVVISGSDVGDYNGTFAITVIDEDSFSIPVAFAGPAAQPGVWETVLPRSPSSRSEASVSIRVIGVNDPPVAVADTITNVTERSLVRIMTRPELAGQPLVFPGDPVPGPDPLTQDVLGNDTDVDSDDTWETLRVVGVLGALNPILGYSGVSAADPVTVHAPDHGLISATEILIANYGGHPSYNGYHLVTVIDEDHFTIPRFFVDDHPEKGVWVILNEANRYSAQTDVDAAVSLVIRADPLEDHMLYDASASAFLRGLAENEQYTNRFYYAVADSHGAIGIGPVDVIVDGVNDTPVPKPDPDSLDILDPLVDPTNTLESVLSGGLDLMYTLPPASGGPDRVDLFVLDVSGLLPGTLTLRDFFVTDEDTPLAIDTADLLANDTDIDRIDMLTIVSVDSVSREGAALSLNAGTITFNPTVSSNLQALAREEMLIDTFRVVVSDGGMGGQVTSLVAVLVIGLNDTPVANPVFLTTHEDEVLVFDPRFNDVDLDINFVEPDDRISIVPAENVPNPGQARVDMSTTNVTHDAPASDLLNQLADWQSFTNVFPYTISDNSFLFAVDDSFYVPAGTTGKVLNVLANDRDYTDSDGNLVIVDAGPTLNGGTVTIHANGQHVVYSSPPGFAGDDYFRYTIENDRGDRNSGRVMVRSVIAPLNGVLLAAPDHFAVAAGETATLHVLANDGMLPNGGGLVITALIASSQPGQPVLTNNTFVYTATNGLAPLTFRYEISGGGSSRAQADVTVDVIERRGTLTIQNDAFSILPGSFNNELDVLENDGLVNESKAALRIREILTAPSHGVLTTNAAATRLIYTPATGFIGMVSFQYLATDQIGGTGTGLVTLAVGQPETAPDFYKIAATTNPVPVVLNVLANDRTMPAPVGGLTLLSVNPSAPTAIGTLQVGGAGTHVLFTPSNAIGQVDFDYVVQDAGSPARLATGRVTIATVPNGIYANPDRYSVRGGGVEYVLNVLTNDISYPNINKTYSILAIGTGANAPNQGGTVIIDGSRLLYTPAPGFFGEESFTYQMSDSIGTDVAQVTVSVRRGDLRANDDHYAVFYEVPPGTNVATSFVLPVVLNDAILPAFDQVIEVVALGAGTNQPNQGGSVQIAPDKQSLIYRPGLASATGYVEQFTYEISDGGSRRSSASVRVKVQNRASNLVAITQHDAFAVARNSSNNVLNVLANDFVRPGTAAGWIVTGVSPSQQGGLVTASNGVVRYSPPAGFVGMDVFSYSVNDGLGGTGQATVTVKVGSMPTLDDVFTVLSGTANNILDVLANDVLEPDYLEEYTLADVFGASAGGVVAVTTNNTIGYTPNPGYAGSYPYHETFLYTVSDDTGGLVTGVVRVIVHLAGSDRASSTITLLVEGRNDEPVIHNQPNVPPITDKQTVKPFLGVTIVEVDEQYQELVDVLVSLDDPAKGVLAGLGLFTDLGGGQYALIGVTGANATLALRALIFVPTENRIPVPTSENTVLTISVTDNKSPPVIDSQTVVTVTAVNDSPVISGTLAGQEYYYKNTIQPFTTVTIGEVDDLALQPLTVTVTQLPSSPGSLTQLGVFAMSTSGVYVATGVSAADATAALRAMIFSIGTNVVPPGGAILTGFRITVDDGFAPPVDDLNASVIARNPFESTLRPANQLYQGSFGQSVDIHTDFAVVGAANASYSATNSGLAVVYRRTGVGTNSWEEWRELQPAGISTNYRFGRAVAIDGARIAVGAIGDREAGVPIGAVYLFERDRDGADNWGEALRISPVNVSSGANFGLSVALDGDLLAVGAPTARFNATGAVVGAVFVFERNAGGPDAWGEIMRWSPSGAGTTNGEFGFSVALSGDSLVVGAQQLNVNTANTNREGKVFHFRRDQGGPNAWGLAQEITSPQSAISIEFGWALSLHQETLVVSAPAVTVSNVARAGRVYQFRKEPVSNDFVYVTAVDRHTNPERRFGNSVAVHGNRMLVGAPENVSVPNVGAVYLYERADGNATNWLLVEKFLRPVGVPAGLFGAAVALDQDLGIVGAPADLTNTNAPVARGYAFIYRFGYNRAPVAADIPPDQFGQAGQPFAYAVPSGAFIDPDPDDVLTFRADFLDGANGLSFSNGVFSGIPVDDGIYPVALVADDGRGGVTSVTFRIFIGIPAPTTLREAWNIAYFGLDITNTALQSVGWGGAADPDGDLRSNDEEYAFVTDPQQPDADLSRLWIDREGHSPRVLSYQRRWNDSGLVFHLEYTTNMATWVNGILHTQSETSVKLDAEAEFVTVEIITIDGVKVVAYRIRVDL
ncbi:MAG TPA: Ig-like domain-containing protein [Kiritimatiellia bacterium]|nr:Ig-like domain-containing protein [Kiritimatiellia bacterium]